jgi:hypothetical protein
MTTELVISEAENAEEDCLEQWLVGD